MGCWVGRALEIAALRTLVAPRLCLWGIAGVGTTALARAALPNVRLIERADTLTGAELRQLLASEGPLVLTSRRRLTGENLAIENVPVLPLPSDEATTLFLSQLKLRSAHPSWGEVKEHQLQELLALLGGVPRAILEAAERAAVAAPEELLAIIQATPWPDDELRALDDLSPAAHELLGLLACAGQGLTLASLAAGSGHSIHATSGALCELSDRGLLRYGEPRALHVLLPPIAAGWSQHHPRERRAAMAKVASSLHQRAAAPSRADAHGQTSVEERTNAIYLLEALDAMTAEQRDFVLEECAQMARRGALMSVVRERLDRALLAEASYGAPKARARMLLARADLNLITGQIADALGDLSEANKLAQMVSDAEIEARACCVMARARHWESSFDDGLAALAQYEAGDVRSPVEVNTCIGILTYGLGEVDSALAHLQRAHDQLQRSAPGDHDQRALLLGLIGMLHRDRDQVLEARAAFHEARALTERTNNRLLGAIVRNWLGLAYLDDSELDAAVLELEAARAGLEALGEEQFQRAALGYLGLVAHLEGRLEDAERLLAQAAEMSRRARDVYRSCLFVAHLAYVRTRLGQRTEALLDAAAAVRWLSEAEYINPNLPEVLHLLWPELQAAPAESRADCSTDVRIARRLVGLAQRQPVLTVQRQGRWFQLDDSARVPLARRKLLARLLGALAAGERGMTSEELFAVGWPNEQALRSSALHRVHAAISELRKLGLSVLVLDESGYRLRAELRLVDDSQR